MPVKVQVYYFEKVSFEITISGHRLCGFIKVLVNFKWLKDQISIFPLEAKLLKLILKMLYLGHIS